MLIILWICSIIIFMLAYLINKRDLLAPSVLCSMIYVICIMFTVLNQKAWGIEYSDKAFCVMIIMILSFVLPSFFFNIGRNRGRMNSDYELEIIRFDKGIIIVCLVVDILISIYYFKEVYRISIIGGNPFGIAGMFSYYRMYTANNIDAEGLSTLANQFLKLGRSFGFTALFILMYNNQINRNIKRDYWLIPFVVLTAIQNIIGGGRGYILWLISTGFITSYIINMKKSDWKKIISFRYIKIGLKLMVVVFVGFYLLKYVVRVGNTVNSILDYIGYYAGGSIQNFNLYLENPPTGSRQIWGQETFMGIYSTLQKFGFVDASGIYLTNSNLEFRWSNGVSIGNVYGAVRRYYNDFGIMGVIVLQIICSVFFNAFYGKIKHQNKNKTKFTYFLYAYMSYHIFEMPIDDVFYKSFISFNFLTTLFVLFVVYYLFTCVKIKKLKIKYRKRNII